MKTTRLILVLIALSALFSCNLKDENKKIEDRDLTEYVNTLIGTQAWSGKIQLAGPELAEGHTYPGVCPPFAMTEWTPQTTTGAIPYWYEKGDKAKIQGFRATHYPSGAVMSEYGSFTLFPATGKPEINSEKRASSFSHENEIAKPHYYSVLIDDNKIKAEITATSRVGFLQFTFPESDSSTILLDFNKNGGQIQVNPEKREISGYSFEKGQGTPENFASYFVACFEKEINDFKIISEKAGNNSSAGWVSFSTKQNELVKVKVATSFISIEQALKNLDDEIPHWDFTKVSEQTKALWNDELNKIQIEGASEADKTIFYTSMYHALLLPREFSEQGKYYSPYDGKVHKGVSFTDFSLWDTYRAEHPLLLFLVPDKVNLMIQSLLNTYDEGGWIPKWPNPGYSNVMMGTHADAMIADAYIKGVRDYDVDKAWEAMQKNANELGTGRYEARLGIKDYNYYGFVPGDKYGESIARTMEFAFDDFCLAQMAKSLGKDADYGKYIKRANNYKNVLDPETMNVRGKTTDGCWMDANDKSISVWAGYTDQSLEVYKWNHTFLVPHDVDGLITFFKGKPGFINALDTLFSKEYYYVGDEFSMHVPYLYNYAGKPWKTQKLVRQILKDYFAEGPDGLCGNDDCGQLSSWYIFGAMGFYPVAPGDDYYTIGSLLFGKLTMSLPNGKQFRIIAENVSDENVYIQSATLNGETYAKSYLLHKDIMQGGTLKFEMSNTPNKSWGSKEGDIPVSSIENFDYLPGPSIKSESTSFEDSLTVTLESVLANAWIYYTLDGSEPTKQKQLYEDPLVIKTNTTLKALTYKKGMQPSVVMKVDFFKRPKGRSVKLLTNYSDNYTGGGPDGLIDYKWGNYFFKSTCWQGYEEVDMIAVVDVGSMQKINKISVSFLQDVSNWIFCPTAVEYYISNDGTNFKIIETIEISNEKELKGTPEIKYFNIETNQSCRYVKVVAKNQKQNPVWHSFAGAKSWLFVDEIIIK